MIPNLIFISGDSSSSAELLKHEHKKLLPEAKQLQERALKITKATEQLVASGCFAGEQATEKAYGVLSATSDYLSDLQSRDFLLDRVIAFFRSAQTVTEFVINSEFSALCFFKYLPTHSCLNINFPPIIVFANEND